MGIDKVESSIGTYSEKCTHKYLKNYIDSDESHHEIKVGKYIADVVNEHGIFEIQSKGFYRLYDKLQYYISNHKHVTVVLPVHCTKYINWIDPITGDIVETRKSPRKQSKYSIFTEMYGICDLISNEYMHFKVIALETNEYKYLDGFGENHKLKATKIDKIPYKIIYDIDFDKTNINKFIPDGLKEQFNSSDFKKTAKCSKEDAQTTLLILTKLGIVVRVGRNKQGYVYELNNLN